MEGLDQSSGQPELFLREDNYLFGISWVGLSEMRNTGTE